MSLTVGGSLLFQKLEILKRRDPQLQKPSSSKTTANAIKLELCINISICVNFKQYKCSKIIVLLNLKKILIQFVVELKKHILYLNILIYYRLNLISPPLTLNRIYFFTLPFVYIFYWSFHKVCKKDILCPNIPILLLSQLDFATFDITKCIVMFFSLSIFSTVTCRVCAM